MAQRCERIGCFSGLGDEQGQAAGLEHRVSITKFRCEIEVYRHPGKGLEPIFRDHPGIIAGAASDDGDALDVAQVKIHLRQRDLLFERPDIAPQGLGNHGRLLEDFLLHEVAIIAFLDRRCRHTGGADLALHRVVVLVMDGGALAGNDHPVALFEIGNFLRQRRQSQSVRTEIGLAFAIADHQRRTEPGTDQEVRM